MSDLLTPDQMKKFMDLASPSLAKGQLPSAAPLAADEMTDVAKRSLAQSQARERVANSTVEPNLGEIDNLGKGRMVLKENPPDPTPAQAVNPANAESDVGASIPKLTEGVPAPAGGVAIPQAPQIDKSASGLAIESPDMRGYQPGLSKKVIKDLEKDVDKPDFWDRLGLAMSGFVKGYKGVDVETPYMRKREDKKETERAANEKAARFEELAYIAEIQGKTEEAAALRQAARDAKLHEYSLAELKLQEKLRDQPAKVSLVDAANQLVGEGK